MVCVCVICMHGLHALTHKAVLSDQLQSQLVCQHRGVAMGDVGEGPSVDKHRRTLQQLRGVHKHMGGVEKTLQPMATEFKY